MLHKNILISHFPEIRLMKFPFSNPGYKKRREKIEKIKGIASNEFLTTLKKFHEKVMTSVFHEACFINENLQSSFNENLRFFMTFREKS